ncbi:type II secretion system F family protein [Acidocella aromatica]|uniref:Tight adherence protein C n=1 Tax=Acidocella aromatica TaxID=1303579 RepID=A0A840VGL6_9PROT|nr:type II secretion system F family protein [Acidocella aromatica]MBB5372345.1 tight adherence protein C [Acidocella aromatica]
MYSNNTIFALLLLVVLFFALLAGVGFMLAHELGRNVKLERRLNIVVNGGEEELPEQGRPPGTMLLRVISAFGMGVARSGLLSRKTLAEMTATLEGVGFKGGKGLGLFIGSKILLVLVSPIITFVVAQHAMHLSGMWLIIATAGGAVGGMLLPETIATNIRTKHLEKVAAGVPDALDMLVICADAGLALEAGIARVAQEISTLNPALASELQQTSHELQIGADMRHAMDNLGERTGLETLKRLATTLAQSLQYGTPLTQALRSLSAELRAEALVKFEERAGRLPTLMTMPMILFILPCVFLIVAGPAIINVMATMHGH